MHGPKVSVVMPVYNAEQYVAQAMDSILGQTERDFEFIVVDDCSTDSSLEIVRSYRDDRIRVCLHSENRGYPQAMRTGLAVARGAYMARMDADDWCAPERLERQCAFLDTHGDFVFVAIRRFWITPRGKTYADPHPSSGEWTEETWGSVYSGKREFTDPSVMARRASVESAGGYRTYLRSGQDVDLWLRLLEAGGRAATLTDPLFGRRLLPGAITFSDRTTANNRVPRILADERKATGTDAVMRGERIEHLVTPEIVKQSHGWRVRALWAVATLCLEAGDIRSSLDFAVRALRVGKFRASTYRNIGKFLLRAVQRRAEVSPSRVPQMPQPTVRLGQR